MILVEARRHSWLQFQSMLPGQRTDANQFFVFRRVKLNHFGLRGWLWGDGSMQARRPGQVVQWGAGGIPSPRTRAIASRGAGRRRPAGQRGSAPKWV